VTLCEVITLDDVARLIRRKTIQHGGGGVLLGDLDVKEASDHIPAHGAFVGLFLEVVGTFPAHAVVPAWENRRVSGGAEADDAVVARLHILL
jgi:hypothetical protein